MRKFTKMDSLPATEIIERYQSGDSLRQVASSFGTSANMIKRLLEKHGVSRRQEWDRGKGSRLNLSPLPADEIIAEYRAGASLNKLAQEYEVSATRITTLLESHGVPRRSSRDVPWTGKSRVLTREQEEDVVHRHQQGQSARGIARDLGLSHPTISGVLLRNGINPADAVRPALTDEQIREVRALYAQGIGSKKLADRFGVSPPTILRAIPESERRKRGGTAPPTKALET